MHRTPPRKIPSGEKPQKSTPSTPVTNTVTRQLNSTFTQSPKMQDLSQTSTAPAVSQDSSSQQQTAEGLSGSLYKVNRLIQECKKQLQMSGNIKTTIKDTVLKNILEVYDMYAIADQKIKSLENQLLQVKLEHVTELHTQEKRHTSQLATRLQTGPGAESTGITDDKLGKLVQRATEAAEKVETLTGNLNNLKAAVENWKTDDATYAEMLSRPRILPQTAAPPNKPIHSIIVSSSNEKDTSGDVINHIQAAVDATKTGLRVDRVRKARDQKVIIGCGTKEEITLIKERIETAAPTLKVDEARNKDPLIMIRDIFNVTSEEKIVSAIKAQNRQLLGDIPEDEYRTIVRYRKKARNQLASHVVLQVSPAVWGRVTSAGKLYIDMQRVTVTDQTPLIQCTRCLGYGHGKKLCKETEDSCSHCAGKHQKHECQAWKDGLPATCRNCKHSNVEKAEHNAFDGECPIRRKWDTIARLSVAYC